ADRVARARLELLNPGHGELIFIDVIDWQGTSDHWLERVDTTIAGYQRAIKHYDDALWWARFRPGRGEKGVRLLFLGPLRSFLTATHEKVA
ncbi:MAG: hypothetical protein V3W34_07470, partial [Phycisphaerae bacterium]